MMFTSMVSALTRARALQNLAAGPFLSLGPHLHEFKPLIVQKTTKVCVGDEQDLATWRGDGALFFTIACLRQTMGSSDSATIQVIYEHDTDTVYFLRREAWIKDLPEDTQLVGQYVEDQIEGRIQPNFMVFDIIKHNKNDMRCIPPPDRYAILQAVANGFNRAYITLQWVGVCNVVKELLDKNRTCIPHEIKCGLYLTKDPLFPSILM